MRALVTMIAVCAGLLIAGCGGGDDSTSESTQAESGSTQAEEGAAPVEKAASTAGRTKPEVTVPEGEPPQQLEQIELIEGTGKEAKSGDKVTVQYLGVGYQSREEFDSSWSRNEPFTFTLGVGEVIPGWDQGVVGMKVGGRRELIVPPELAYGQAGVPPGIGPNETLIFVVDLVAVG